MLEEPRYSPDFSKLADVGFSREYIEKPFPRKLLLSQWDEESVRVDAPFSSLFGDARRSLQCCSVQHTSEAIMSNVDRRQFDSNYPPKRLK